VGDTLRKKVEEESRIAASSDSKGQGTFRNSCGGKKEGNGKPIHDIMHVNHQRAKKEQRKETHLAITNGNYKYRKKKEKKGPYRLLRLPGPKKGFAGVFSSLRTEEGKDFGEKRGKFKAITISLW